MSTEYLKRVNKELKQKVRDKQQDEKEVARLGLMSEMFEESTDRIVESLRRIEEKITKINN